MQSKKTGPQLKVAEVRSFLAVAVSGKKKEGSRTEENASVLSVTLTTFFFSLSAPLICACHQRLAVVTTSSRNTVFTDSLCASFILPFLLSPLFNTINSAYYTKEIPAHLSLSFFLCHIVSVCVSRRQKCRPRRRRP